MQDDTTPPFHERHPCPPEYAPIPDDSAADDVPEMTPDQQRDHALVMEAELLGTRAHDYANPRNEDKGTHRPMSELFAQAVYFASLLAGGGADESCLMAAASDLVSVQAIARFSMAARKFARAMKRGAGASAEPLAQLLRREAVTFALSVADHLELDLLGPAWTRAKLLHAARHVVET